MSVQDSSRQPTWLQVAVVRVGMFKGASAISWALAWGATREVIGRAPNAEDVAYVWGLSVSTAYRYQSSFRKAFPELDDPAPYVDIPEVNAVVVASGKQIRKLIDWAERRSQEKSEKRPKRPSLDAAVKQIGFIPCPIPM